MRLFTAALAAGLLLAAPAFARNYGEIVPRTSAMYKADTTPADKIPALCAKIIADQNKSKVAMEDAGTLLFHGEMMGQHCVTVDYVKALTLEQKAGDMVQYSAFVKILRGRAATGNPGAVSAMEKLHLTP